MVANVVSRRRTLAVSAIVIAFMAVGASAAAQPDFSPPLYPAQCADGTYVDDPESKPGLVADCIALVAVRNHFMNNPLNYGTQWDTPWRGVTIDGDRAVALDLSSTELSGAVPPELGDLTRLRYLHLGDNQLSGTIPPELGAMTELDYLHLGGNELSDPIPPELGDLAQLDYLHLGSNQLTGATPPELGNLTNLRSLHLESNQLTGVVPPELGSMTSLEYMYLHSNELSGSVPPELGNLTNLRSLHLESNQLTGPIPPELGNLTRLDYLHLEDNQLTGTIPPELGNLTRLGYLYLHINELSGPIPPELASLTRLDLLYLHSNNLSGSVPPELGNLTNLRSLHLESNQLTGPIPPELGNLAKLDYLHLEDNRLTGTIPPELGNLTRLDLLHLENNQLSGIIPEELGDVVLWRLWVQNNRLSGEIPSKLRVARSFKFCHNRLTGALPPQLHQVAENFTGDVNDIASCYEGTFSDDDGSVHEEDIETIAEWEITLGCGADRFCPSETVTRSQMAAFLYRAVARLYGAPEADSQVEFTDVAADAWYRPHAQWAAGSGVMRTADGSFNPGAAVTRADMAEMLVAAFDHLSAANEPQNLFSDVSGLSEAAVLAIEGIHEAGVTQGCETAPLRYCPAEEITRAQMASLLARAVAGGAVSGG